jgi:hypothetical protein
MSAAGPLANGLYPIIRRARRPFIIADDDAAPAPAPPPVATLPEAVSVAPVEMPKPEGGLDTKRKKSRDNATNN